MNRIGIDLGGTKIEGIVLDAGGAELFRKRISTERENGYAHILERIAGLHDELVTATASRAHTFGIGTPGAISRRTGLLKNSNTVCLNGQPLKADLERRLGRPIEIQNDANCFAMAEAMLGAGKGKELVFGVIMGTGCGGESFYSGGGAGGSVYITCHTFAGTSTNASISADGGPGGNSSGGGGGGGRIAVWSFSKSYSGAASTKGGTSISYSSGSTGTVVLGQFPLPAGTIIYIK